MTVEDGGHQPVVVLKQGNACGAKGHRQDKFGMNKQTNLLQINEFMEAVRKVYVINLW